MSKRSVLLTVSLLVISLFLSATGARPASAAVLPDNLATSFRFMSMGDAQADSTRFAATVNQIATLNPAFVIFNGDLENDGVTSSEMNPMISALKNANLFNNTFLVRGNHDNHVSGSATLWENYFETDPNIKVLPAGVTNYVAPNSASDYLSYSFDYGNSIFIGLDVPGNVGLLTAAQLNFLDTRLTYAENQGLTHAFIFFHGPEYCVESVHCNCSSKTDASCTPSSWVSVINKHPIVSATFHGHEHVLGWTHMDNTRVAGLTGNYEQFITSPSGGWTYNSYLYPNRMDYTYLNMGSATGFATIDVNGASFTFSIYKVGTTQPVWSNTYYKTGGPTATPSPTSEFTPTSIPTRTATSTAKPTLTRTATSTAKPTFTQTATSTAGPTLTFTPTTILDDTSTGFLPPTANKAVTINAGDQNGYERRAKSAYTPNGAFAADLNSGTGINAPHTNDKKDKHLFYNYNFDLPAGAAIQGIQVRVDARTDNRAGSPKIYVQFSWNGGQNWTTAKATNKLGTVKTTYILGSATNTWGHTWSPADFSNANFRVRVIDMASNTSRDFYLDYIAVNVTYQP